MMCVYQILNLKTSDIYIGSAINLSKRKLAHIYHLRNKTHHSRYLQNAYNKYGEENFNFSVLEIVHDKQQLTNIEQLWIDKLVPKYNVMRDIKSHIGIKRSIDTCKKLAQAQRGKVCSRETKAKISKSLTGKKHSEETKRKRAIKAYKPILQLSKDTNILIKEWESATVAAKTLGISRGAIYESLNKRKEPFKEFVWRFKDENKNC